MWIDNRSPDALAVFVTDLSDRPAAWYRIPGNTAVHAGSAGLRFDAVRVNVMGWRHDVNNVDECSPGDYEDTLYDVPAGASVRLLVEPDGTPSVALATEPPGLPTVAVAELGGGGLCP